VRNGYQFRLYPSKEQVQILLRWIGCQRVIYNTKVTEDRYFRRFRNKTLALTGLQTPIDQTYAQFITQDTAFLREVPATVLRNGAARWAQGYTRFFAHLGGRPTIQKKSGKQSVWLTSDLFRFLLNVDEETGEVLGHTLHIGTKKFPVGEMEFVAHRDYDHLPASIHISVQNGKWFLSFNAEDERLEEFKEKTIIEKLLKKTNTELWNVTLGGDRGVAKPLMTSDGEVYALTDIQKKRIAEERKRKVHWQRKAAKRKKGSRNRQKAYQKVARYQRYEANVRQDFAHQTSHRLVHYTNAELIVFEDLKIKNMTKRSKAKKDANGKFVKNGARAKAGLNKAILASAWGQIATFTNYKALRAGKLMIKVAPQYSSQECAVCGYTHEGNRPTQAEFTCLRCGHEDNADHNAAIVIKQRGIKALREYQVKEKKNAKLYKSKLGSGRSEAPLSEAKPVESQIRLSAGDGNKHSSRKQEPETREGETPASA
jgi:putative transposase